MSHLQNLLSGFGGFVSTLRLYFFYGRFAIMSSRKKRLEMSHIFLPLECVFCNHHSEDLVHLFIDCTFCVDAFAVLASRYEWPPPPVLGDMSFLEYFMSLPKVFCLGQLAKIVVAWWFFWYARNIIYLLLGRIPPLQL